MLNISGYRIIETIYESAKTVVYRGHRQADQEPVIVKVTTTYPTPAEIAKFKHEYEISNSLDSDGIIKALALLNYHNGLALILEDFGGTSLNNLLASSPMELSAFLPIAIRLSEIIGYLHQHNIIHKDIKPQNIIINPHTKQVKITDFSISSRLNRENQTVSNPNLLEGTLAYISPEQTGRMNRIIDYRTDFYSLGVTFYEMVTGQLPFPFTDPMELVHCHIAKKPVPPHQLNPEIPIAISDIILKLLSKTAEDRYQGVVGLKADLEICLRMLQDTGNIANFPIGQCDRSARLEIPQKLYGRESEIPILMDAFDRVSCGTTEIILVAGYSGVGKSALVNEIQKPIVRQRGYFISGKFDQFKQNIPYASLIQAFQELIRQLLTESEAQIQAWQEKLLAALGSNGQVIIDVIPEVELIIGKHQPVQHLGATESQNRFNFVFREFIGVFTKKEHPLVCFLDDLQWADSASLKLIELLMSDPDRQYLLLIGAYRDNEVDAGHPFILTLNEIKKVGTAISTITLQPLTINNVNQLIADTLICETEKSLTLAELLYQKTNGNPFFLTQLIKSLYSENLLTLSPSQSTVPKGENQEGWQWDIEQIKGIGITDNVVELMIGKIQSLASKTQNVLKLAACIGNQFELDILAIVNQKSAIATANDLWEGLQTGFILPLSDAYKIPMLASSDEQEITDGVQLKIPYKFLHDRVQQAAYSLIPDDEKKAVQLQIGRLLLKNTPSQERAEKVFEIVNHINLGQELITDHSEKIELSELNLEAGKKAKDATAYASALQYLKVGMNAIKLSSWELQYELNLALHKELAEVEYLNGNFEQSETLTDLIFERAKSNLEKAEVYNLLIVQYTQSGKYVEAIAAGSKALKILDIDLPDTELPTAIGIEIGQVKENLGDKKIADLINEPVVTIPEQKGAMQLLMNLIPAAYFCNQPLMSFIAVKSVNLSLQYGLVPDLPYSYSIYGLILSCALGDYQGGYEFCQLAMKVSERFNNLAQKGKTCLVLGGNVHLWLKPIKSSFPIMDEGYKASLESGDLAFVGYIHLFKSVNLMCQNSSLVYLVEEIAKFLLICKKTQNQPAINTVLGINIIGCNLLGLTESKLAFNTEEINEAQYLEICQKIQDLYSLCTYYIFKAQVLYLYGEYLEALRLLEESEKLLPNIIGQFGVAEHNFYYSLTLAALYPTVTAEIQQEYWQKLEANQKQIKIWADNCPENFLNRYLLVAAEMERLSGNDLVAMDLYDRAIFTAIENEFIQNEALANELAAKFWLHRRKQEFAELYLKKAYYGYQRWGAKYKVEDLETQYPQFRLKTSTIASTTSLMTGTDNISTHATGSHTSILDFSTVVKASQALASELVLDQMLTKLMKIMIENAGAQVGYLIWESQKQWVIEAEGVVDSEEAIVLQSIPIETSQSVSRTIVNYVARTQESVVLNDATKEGKFTQDPYIQQRQPKSVLCFPLINQGKLTSIIYLENNLTTGAFTPDRLEVLKVLSSQAAISIENARLYQNLEDKVTERTAQLGQANQEITDLNNRLKTENIRMSAELQVTKKLQEMILPKASELEAVEGLEIAGFMEPADEVGGDYYDVLQQNGKVKIGIGDVSGHGLESGVLMIMAQTAVRTLQESNEADPVRFLDILNRTLYGNIERMKSSKNMTLALLDYADGIISLSGQHEEMIVVRTSGVIEKIDTMELGFPIALVEDIADAIASTQVQLNQGDVVVLYTDGITEAANINQVLYGLDRLCELACSHRQESAQQIKQAVITDVKQFIGEQKVFDDITLLVLKQK